MFGEPISFQIMYCLLFLVWTFMPSHFYDVYKYKYVLDMRDPEP